MQFFLKKYIDQIKEKKIGRIPINKDHISDEDQKIKLFDLTDESKSDEKTQDLISQLAHKQSELEQCQAKNVELTTLSNDANVRHQVVISELNEKVVLVERDYSKILAERNKLLKQNKESENLNQFNVAKISNEKLEIENELALYKLRLNQSKEEIENLFEKFNNSTECNRYYSNILLKLKTINQNFYGYPSIEISDYIEEKGSQVVVVSARDVLDEQLSCKNLTIGIQLFNSNLGVSYAEDGKFKQFIYPENIASNSSSWSEFIGLSTSQWNLYYMSAIILQSFKMAILSEKALSKNLDKVFWHPFVDKLTEAFFKLPKILRYDKIELKRELVNKDYEHLWLVMNNFSYENYSFEKFEFRISAAEIIQNQFTKFPKFEFPLLRNKNKPFQTWFEESRDEYGAKLEIRFDCDKKIMDVKTLAKMSNTDQRMIINIVFDSIKFIRELYKTGVQISRKWSEWEDLSLKSAEIIRSYLNEKKEVKVLPSQDKKNTEKIKEKFVKKNKRLVIKNN